ncbi:MAG TPA: hypothetical protein VHF86_04460 [Xanthomonadaceae bacterium]|nr:hypothetical protein [Xanthomonadaceae bacterium]
MAPTSAISGGDTAGDDTPGASAALEVAGVSQPAQASASATGRQARRRIETFMALSWGEWTWQPMQALGARGIAVAMHPQDRLAADLCTVSARPGRFTSHRPWRIPVERQGLWMQANAVAIHG